MNKKLPYPLNIIKLIEQKNRESNILKIIEGIQLGQHKIKSGLFYSVRDMYEEVNKNETINLKEYNNALDLYRLKYYYNNGKNNTQDNN